MGANLRVQRAREIKDNLFLINLEKQLKDKYGKVLL